MWFGQRSNNGFMRNSYWNVSEEVQFSLCTILKKECSLACSFMAAALARRPWLIVPSETAGWGHLIQNVMGLCRNMCVEAAETARTSGGKGQLVRTVILGWHCPFFSYFFPFHACN